MASCPPQEPQFGSLLPIEKAPPGTQTMPAGAFPGGEAGPGCVGSKPGSAAAAGGGAALDASVGTGGAARWALNAQPAPAAASAAAVQRRARRQAGGGAGEFCLRFFAATGSIIPS